MGLTVRVDELHLEIIPHHSGTSSFTQHFGKIQSTSLLNQQPSFLSLAVDLALAPCCTPKEQGGCE